MTGRFLRSSAPPPVALTRRERGPLAHVSFKRLDQATAAPVVMVGPGTLGSHPLNDVVVDHPAVCPFHAEVRAGEQGLWLWEVDCSPGLEVDGVRASGARLRDASIVRFGNLTVRFNVLTETTLPTLSRRDSLGGLWGSSEAMREVYARLERVAGTSRPVLLVGARGAGKSTAAEAIHALGPRAESPFVAMDLSGLSEAEALQLLFGSMQPARASVFEEVGTGTLYLHEVGSLPLAVQERLVPVLDGGEVLRLGATAAMPVKARIVASSSEDLRALVNAGLFLPGLLHRLAVVQVRLPALHERLEDLPTLVDVCLERLAIDPATAQAVRQAATIDALAARRWPGNVAELFEAVERLATLRQVVPVPLPDATPRGRKVDPAVPYQLARARALDAFDRAYLEALLAAHHGNVGAAARAAGVDRPTLYRLMRRVGVR